MQWKKLLESQNKFILLVIRTNVNNVFYNETITECVYGLIILNGSLVFFLFTTVTGKEHLV